MKWARTNMFTHAASACWPLKQKGPRLLPSWGSILMAAANAANVNLRKCCPGMCVCLRVCVCCGWQHLCNIICGQFHFSERVLWLRPFSLLAPKPINCFQAKPTLEAQLEAFFG